jgi:hypothetical protein
VDADEAPPRQPGLAPLIEVYEGLLRQCRSLNWVDHTHYALEGSLTPSDVLYLYPVLCGDDFWVDAERLTVKIPLPELKSSSRKWIEKLKNFHDLSGKSEPEPFGRLEVLNTLTLFTDGREAGEKTLIVCFTGSGARPMMPVCAFMQALDARRVDLAVLRDIPFRGFRQGILGIGDSFDAILSALPRLLQFEGYARVAVIGISAGAMPALLFSLINAVTAALLVGIVPNDPRWHSTERTGLDLVKRANRLASVPKVTLVYGAQAAEDIVQSEAIAGILPATLVCVSDPENGVGHNALFPLLKQGRLGELLARALEF